MPSMIGKWSDLLVSGGRVAGPLDSPIDTKMQSPRGYDLGGVGLGIVVALDKDELFDPPPNPKRVSTFNRSGPIPLHSVTNPNPHPSDSDSDSEDYTYVTSHVPHKTFTRVYYHGSQAGFQKHATSNNNNNVGSDSQPSFPTSNFLSSCHLCTKKLHGKDIYMYRGEKAFCSQECRSSQIMMEERKERCGSEASMSVEKSSSPYTREQIFSTRILAL